uniref:probable cytochrome P450 12a5, mitochondrial n=1 Tax=Ciona intestinalis TaxID=7719 RepID=UPI000180D255
MSVCTVASRAISKAQTSSCKIASNLTTMSSSRVTGRISRRHSSLLAGTKDISVIAQNVEIPKRDHVHRSKVSNRRVFFSTSLQAGGKSGCPMHSRFIAPTSTDLSSKIVMGTFGIGWRLRSQWRVAAQNVKHQITQALSLGETKTSVREVQSYSEIPGPRGLPFLGSVLEYTAIGKFSPKQFHKALRSRHGRYGKIFRERLLQDEFVYVSDPKDIRVLVQNEGKAPCRPHLEAIVAGRKQLKLPVGITAEQGNDWLRSRTSINGGISCPRALKTYRAGQQVIAEDFVELIRNKRDATTGEVPQFEQWLNRWALESIAIAMLNTRLGLFDAGQFKKNRPAEKLRECMDIFFDYGARLTFGVPMWKIFNTREWKTFCQSQVDEFENAGYFVNKKLKQLKEERGSQEASKQSPSCLLEHLISKNSEVSQMEATTICLELLAGGIDTTATAAVFTLFELSRNKEHQSKLRELANQETDEGKNNSQFSRYLKSCIWESMRLHPLTYANMRKTETDLVLSGYKVPAGTTVRYTSHLMNLKDEKYFPQADEFLPERWLDRKSENRCKEQFTFTPFGHGARQCPGRRIAEQELDLLFRQLIRNFNIDYEHEDIKTKVRLFNAADRPARFSFTP